MVHVIYDINAGGLDEAFPLQYGSGAVQQLGGGSYFQGIKYQRGYGLGYPRQGGSGLGTLLKSVWRLMSPIAKSVGQSLTQQGLASGANILENIAQGANVKDAVVTEGKRAVKTLAKTAADEIKRRQTGSGARGIGATRKKSRIRKTRSLVGRSARSSTVKKRRRADTLGFY